MKIKLDHILILTFAVLMVSAGSAMAQDASIPEVETVVDSEREKAERDKILYSPGEAETKYTPKTQGGSPAKDSAAVILPVQKFKSEKPAPTPKTAVDKQSKEEDESILSFNFLYYIIEKYKLQDIVD